jgi:hypothetical protein
MDTRWHASFSIRSANLEIENNKEQGEDKRRAKIADNRSRENCSLTIRIVRWAYVCMFPHVVGTSSR